MIVYLVIFEFKFKYLMKKASYLGIMLVETFSASIPLL